MQREIKFRAWDKFRRIMCNHEDINIWDRFMKDDMSNQYSPLMQYTGLKDKNGKEIYEGDIVSCYYACGLPFNAVVEFRDGCFDIKSEHSRDYLKVLVANRAIEVIGNIHDNPELLKEDTHE